MTEKENMLRGASSPLNNGDPYYDLPPACQAHERITYRLVELALFSQSGKEVPGPDKLSFGAIRLLWRWSITIIVRLTKAAV